MAKQGAMKTGSGAASNSMNPAALTDAHHKAHRIGVAAAAAHGYSHEGGLGGATAPSATPGPENVAGAGCADQFE